MPESVIADSSHQPDLFWSELVSTRPIEEIAAHMRMQLSRYSIVSGYQSFEFLSAR